MTSLKPKTLGQAFKLALAQAEMTQVELSLLIGETTTAINWIATDNPKRQPTTELITKIERALKLEPMTLGRFLAKKTIPAVA